MKIYNKLVRDIETGKVLFEDSFDYEGPVELAAGGMLTKQAEFLTARFLNDVNDAASGGVIVSVPAGAPSPAVSQTIPGDRIVLDDATASALSDSAIGTLYGGVYMYVGTISGATAAYRRGCIAFWRANELPGGAAQGYTVTSDAQPTTAIPTFIAGIFISAPTAGNFCWIQVGGFASVLYDSASLTNAAQGSWVTAKISATTTSTADVGAAAGVVTLAALLGVAVSSPVASAISSVILTRGNFCGRI